MTASLSAAPGAAPSASTSSLARHLIALILCWATLSFAQEWTGPVRGSWVRIGDAQPGDVVLMDGAIGCEIVLPGDAAPPLKHAATLLAADIEKITGKRPRIAPEPAGSGARIRFLTLTRGVAPAGLPKELDAAALAGMWEASQIVTSGDGREVWLVGSDIRGTAYAAYILSERLGMDPLYLWTGYTPARQTRLVLSRINHVSTSPTVKYRGLFHDDEDILPRPFDYTGVPLVIGNVPTEWYKRFFETALRLRFNMVAPYTRTHRRFEVQQLASDMGLIYTSHHYDILLSNPFGFNRFKLAEKRGVAGEWNWLSNRENMLKYWRAGVEENGRLGCIWPVGLRGTDDYGYPFPKDMSEAEQNRVFQDVIKAQIETTRALVPAENAPPVFTFTLYGEMLDKFLASGGNFEMPEEVILIWPDDNDGRIRALPKQKGKWKHGVYYHLAYYGPVSKQSIHTVHPTRIANEFQKIVSAGATEYMLLNVSELREFVRETRMIADICLDAEAALADTPERSLPAVPLPHVPTEAREPLPPDLPSKSADRFQRWFCAEYFGPGAAEAAVEAYRAYEEILDRYDKQWYAGDRVVGAVASLMKKFAGEEFAPARQETISTLETSQKQHAAAADAIVEAKEKMNVDQRRFFFENCELPLLISRRHTEAAILLIEAMAEKDLKRAWQMCENAMRPLEQLELEIARTEYPPFERWYAKTFIRHEETGLNLHRPYEVLRLFLSSGGKEMLRRPKGRPAQEFMPVLDAYSR